MGRELNVEYWVRGGIACFIALVVLSCASSASAGVLVANVDCGYVSANGTCFATFQSPWAYNNYYTRFKLTNGSGVYHCAKATQGAVTTGWTGCTTGQYAYSSCLPEQNTNNWIIGDGWNRSSTRHLYSIQIYGSC